MINKSALETVDRTFKDIFGADNSALESIPFGGRLIVFGDYFRQVLPMVSQRQLRINMRIHQAQRNNDLLLSQALEQFATMLLEIGDRPIEHSCE
ncbi:hypothetical protein A0J61_04664 [Choanephora cucurbitarum]|uniref:ATP-dependent DNA helicase n=1 Tax=Choanephora cucurbitarum TaxID=101091 RepID=A0A1C7NE02_9FUNG|nr:hypothetical protein A0J61_04664 [Choanephora cucurbitarum]